MRPDDGPQGGKTSAGRIVLIALLLVIGLPMATGCMYGLLRPMFG